MSVQTDTETMEYLRDMISEVLEIEPEELTDTSHFVEDHEADSLRAIEILARIEKKYKITIPQDRLPEMFNLRAVYDTMVEFGVTA
ncbi:acyl carrier protein [Nocardia crassostreae]|uniref:acyl carrier protein n=1 Tax=Nocardia crassostreae TaxID=53428 RepID=UPI00082E753D|nr:acyl carrier protein [Nocardia crassostreae]